MKKCLMLSTQIPDLDFIYLRISLEILSDYSPVASDLFLASVAFLLSAY